MNVVGGTWRGELFACVLTLKIQSPWSFSTCRCSGGRRFAGRSQKFTLLGKVLYDSVGRTLRKFQRLNFHSLPALIRFRIIEMYDHKNIPAECLIP